VVVQADQKKSPATVAGAMTIDTQEAKKMFDQGVTFIDVRKNSDWDAGRIPEAVHLELKKVFTKDSLHKVAKEDQSIILYCNGENCMRSSKASASAVAWGYKKVFYFRDGFPAWKLAGNPLE